MQTDSLKAQLHKQGRVFAASKRTIIRNTLYNLVGQSFVAITALLCIPFIVRGLGADLYGLLALALIMLGSFSLFELGLGRTTTKFVADYLSRGQSKDLGAVIWSSFILQAGLGLIAGVILIIFAPVISTKIKIPLTLVVQTRTVLVILGLTAPVVLGGSAFRGALEGAQRFDLLNLVKVITNLSLYLAPLLGIILHFGIVAIISLISLIKLTSTLAYMLCGFYVFPELRVRFRPDWPIIRALFSYASWVAISNFAVPLIVQIDRFLIAALLSIGAVTYYSVAYDVLNGLWIIPSAISAVLFPAFSNLFNTSREKMIKLYSASLQQIVAMLGPLVIFVGINAYELMLVWQGHGIAEKSAPVLSILVIGLFINSLGWIPSSMLLGINRPDIIAKVHLFQIIPYLGLAYLLITKYGIAGAAIAWTIRVILEASAFFIASWKIEKSTLKACIKPNTINSVVCVGILLVVIAGVKTQHFPYAFKFMLELVLVLGFYLFHLVLLTNRSDRRAIINAFKKGEVKAI